MADQFVQYGEGSTGTTTDSVTLTGVTAGNTIVAFLWSGSDSAPASASVADGQGSYTLRGSSAADGVNAVWVQGFVLENANAGSHTITGTLPSGTATFIAAVEVQGPTSGAYSGGNALFTSNPGTGTDAISSGSATISAAATLIGMASDTATVNVAAAPAVGTGFTSRTANANSTIGSYRVETKAASSNSAATFTAASGQGGSNYVAVAIAILNASTGGTTTTKTMTDTLDAFDEALPVVERAIVPGPPAVIAKICRRVGVLN